MNEYVYKKKSPEDPKTFKGIMQLLIRPCLVLQAYLLLAFLAL